MIKKWDTIKITKDDSNEKQNREKEDLIYNEKNNNGLLKMLYCILWAGGEAELQRVLRKPQKNCFLVARPLRGGWGGPGHKKKIKKKKNLFGSQS